MGRVDRRRTVRMTPFPYKLVAIASGAAHLDMGAFILASLAARGTALLRRGGDTLVSGPQSAALIEHRYGAALVIGVAAATLAIMVLIPFVT